MSRWLFLPNEVLGDLELLANLAPERIDAFAQILNDPEGSFGNRLYLKVSEALGIGDESAAGLMTFTEYVHGEQAEQKKNASDVFKEFDAFLKARTVTEGEQGEVVSTTLTLLRQNRVAIEGLFGEFPGRDRGRKVRRLKNGPLPRVTGLRSFCDMRPVYDKDGRHITGYIPLVTLRVTTNSSRDDRRESVFQLTIEDLDIFKKEFIRISRKLKAIEESFPGSLERKRKGKNDGR